MSSKIINMHSDFFANLIVDAASLVKYTDPKVRKSNDAISRPSKFSDPKNFKL